MVNQSGRVDRGHGIEMATAERTDLAHLLAALTPEQWQANHY